MTKLEKYKYLKNLFWNMYQESNTQEIEDIHYSLYKKYSKKYKKLAKRRARKW